MKKSTILIMISFTTFLYSLSMWLYAVFVPLVHLPEGAVYYLRPGTSKKLFINELAARGILPYPWFTYLYVNFPGQSGLKSGEYLFPKDSTLRSILKQVTAGTGLFYHRFTIVPGWTFLQLRYALIQNKVLRHLLTKMTDKELMQYLGQPNLLPEGQFFPDTYLYTRGISDIFILRHAHHLMRQKLMREWAKRSDKLPYESYYQALIAASLIEKEAYLPEERAIIARVLINRLHKNMLLQFDPTVIYGLGTRYDGRIHRQDLLDKNPYNTYVHKGLPPTPIAMPSLDAIVAALHPAANDFLYFVAKGDGGHQFSKTLEEHHAAVLAASLYQKSTMAKTLTPVMRSTDAR